MQNVSVFAFYMTILLGYTKTKPMNNSVMFEENSKKFNIFIFHSIIYLKFFNETRKLSFDKSNKGCIISGN